MNKEELANYWRIELILFVEKNYFFRETKTFIHSVIDIAFNISLNVNFSNIECIISSFADCLYDHAMMSKGVFFNFSILKRFENLGVLILKKYRNGKI